MFVNRLLRYDWPFGCYLFNLCALCVIDLAVLLDEELVVTEELCALRFVRLYILDGCRSNCLKLSHESYCHVHVEGQRVINGVDINEFTFGKVAKRITCFPSAELIALVRGSKDCYFSALRHGVCTVTVVNDVAVKEVRGRNINISSIYR